MTIEKQQSRNPRSASRRTSPRNPHPGALRGVTTITLETVPGADLYYGLNENKGSRRSGGRVRRIMGLKRFNDLLTRIWENAPTDPWAFWYLVRIEAAIDKSQARVESLLKAYGNRLNEWKITCRQSSSREPLKIEVKFTAPLGYRAANLVVTADGAIRQILHAHHVGMIEDSQAQEELHAVGRSVRAAFETATHYHDFKVNYQALKKRDPRALQAIEKMGEVPPEILSGKQRPRQVPKMHLTTKKPETQKAFWLERVVDAFTLDENDETVRRE